MNTKQFDVLVSLMRGDPESAANKAARAVLVKNMVQVDAARAFGVTRSTVNDAVKRYRDADEKVRKAYDIKAIASDKTREVP